MITTIMAEDCVSQVEWQSLRPCSLLPLTDVDPKWLTDVWGARMVKNKEFNSEPERDLGMDQYLLISFLMG